MDTVRTGATHGGQQQGLSMLELLVTLAIGAILAGIAIPAFASAIKRSTALTINYQLVGLVQFARTQAIMKNTTVTLCGSRDGMHCDGSWSGKVLVFADADQDGNIGAGETVLQVSAPLKPGETLEWRSFRNKPYLQILPTGITYFQNGSFTWCPADRDAHYAVHWILNASGRLRPGQDRNHNSIPEGSDGKDIRCQLSLL